MGQDSWTYSKNTCILNNFDKFQLYHGKILEVCHEQCTVCPRSLDPFHEVLYNIKWVKTSWTYSKNTSVLSNIHTFRTMLRY